MEGGDFRTALGDNIAIARRRKGLSQPELAKAAGTTKGQISDWENARNRPRLEILVAIAGALDVTVDQLIHGDEAFAVQLARQAAEIAKKEMADQIRELERRVDRLSSEKR